MAKKKILQKQKERLPSISKVNASSFRQYSPTKELVNVDKIGAGVMECLLNNDPQGAMEIIAVYLETINKVQTSKKSKIPRSTLYHSLRDRNPTIKTLAKLIHANAA